MPSFHLSVCVGPQSRGSAIDKRILVQVQDLTTAKEQAEKALAEHKVAAHEDEVLKKGLAEAQDLAARSARAKADAENKLAVLEEQVGGVHSCRTGYLSHSLLRALMGTRF